MYANLLPDGSYETAGSAYDWVEWDRLDGDILEEADRIHKMLLAEVWQSARWHKTPCEPAQSVLHYIRTWDTNHADWKRSTDQS